MNPLGARPPVELDQLPLRSGSKSEKDPSILDPTSGGTAQCRLVPSRHWMTWDLLATL